MFRNTYPSHPVVPQSSYRPSCAQPPPTLFLREETLRQSSVQCPAIRIGFLHRNSRDSTLSTQTQQPGHNLPPRLEARARFVATWPCRACAGTLGNKSSTLFRVLIQLFVDGGGGVWHEQQQHPNTASKARTLCKNLVRFRNVAPEYGDVRPNRHWSNLLVITPGRNITSFTEYSFQDEASARCSCT